MKETEEFVPIKFDKMIQSEAYTCIVLASEEKKFVIYTSSTSGKSMQDYLTQTENLRPSTHQLINQIFRGLEVNVKQIVINELEDTTYFARIFLEQKRGDLLHIIEIDARPSDSISLALMHKAPIYCTRSVLEKTIAFNE